MDIQFPQILFQIVNFSVVAGALTFLLYKPVRKMLEERSSRIEEAQKAAEITIAEKKHIEDLKRKAQKDAEKEAAHIMEEATKDSAARKKEIVAEARKEATREAEKIVQSGEQERSARLAKLDQQFAEAVFETVRKVTGVALSKKEHEKLIATELKQLLQYI